MKHRDARRPDLDRHAPGARRSTALVMLMMASALSCGEDAPQPGADLQTADTVTATPDLDIPKPVVDLRADVNRNGVVDLADPTEDAGEETWDARHGAIFLANIDDDDLSCPKVSASISDAQLAACHDAADEAIDGADDLKDLARIKSVPWPAAPSDAVGAVKLVLPGTTGGDPYTYVRLFRKVGGSFKVLGRSDRLSVDDLQKGVELALEGRDIVRDRRAWDGFLDVRLSVTFARGGTPVTETDTVRMRVAPLLMNHHLQALDTLYVSKSGDAGSVAFRADLATAMSKVPGATFIEYPVYDQWTQDFFETGWMAMPGPGGKPHAIKVFVRSANVDFPNDAVAPLRSAGRIVFHARGKDAAAVQQFTLKHPGSMDTLNSLGNLETVPPYSLGGVSYPMGRMIMGNVPGYYPDQSFTLMLEAQSVQKPFYIDTSWLVVGHTDETISFVKTSSKRGWAVALNDPAAARKMLQIASASGGGATKMFVGKSWLVKQAPVTAAITIDQVLADTEVMAESARATVEIAAQLATLKKELGITDAEIIRVPFLHYPVGSHSAAYQPGTVNGTVIADGHFIAPDPHGPVIKGVDIFKQQMSQEFAKHGITVHWAENWDLYHRLLGEVHCGTNALRKLPSNAKWWEAGR